MTRLHIMNLIAATAIVLAAVPAGAQSRSSSDSRRSGQSVSRSSGGRSEQKSSVLRASGRSHTQTQSASSSRTQTQRASGSSRSQAQSSNSSRSRSQSASSQSSRSQSASSQSSRSQSASSHRNETRNGLGNSNTSRKDNSSRYNSGMNPRGGNTGSQPQSVRRGNDNTPRNYRGSEPSRVRMDEHRNVQRVHPRHREPMPFNRPARFWDGGPHYYGYRVNYLPHRHKVVYHWGHPYYVCDGLWYRVHGGHYYVCRPPFGFAFTPNVYGLTYNICRFAFYNDVYSSYRTINDNARTITEQNRIIAENNALIARQNSDIALNRELAALSYSKADRLGLVQSYANASVDYFYDDGVFFTRNADGSYSVIVPPTGALVQELPDDYETITIDSQQYYKVDDTIYEMTIVDGAAYFQVLGQLTGELADKYNAY